MKDRRDVEDIPEDEIGVALDECIESRIAAQEAKSTLLDVHVRLDSAADSHDLPTQPVMQMRDMQNTAREVIEYLENEIEAIEEREAAIKDRLHG